MAESTACPATIVKDSEEVFEMYCETCNRDGTHVVASAFCKSCVAFFCSTCHKYHGKFLPSHKCLEGDKLPHDICTEKCQTHSNEFIKFYCGTCNKFVCYVCKTENHTDRCTMKYLPDFVKDLEKGKEFKELISNKNDITKRLSDTKSAIDLKYERIGSSTADAKSAIKKEKEALFVDFDQEVFKMEEKIQLLKKKDDLRVDTEKSNFDGLKTEIDRISETIKKLPLSPKSQKYKLYIKLKQLTGKLKQVKESVDSLTKDCCKSDDALESELNVQGKELTEKVLKFGTSMKRYNEENDHQESKKVANSLGDIDVRAYGYQNDCCIVSCCLLSKQFLVACDKTNCSLKLIDLRKGAVIHVRPVNTYPQAATKISETQIAIVQRCGEARSVIEFLDVTAAKTLKFKKRSTRIVTEMYCHDIVYISNGRLVISMSNNNVGKVQILDMSGSILADIADDEEGHNLFERPGFITLDAEEEHIYVSDWLNESVTEIDLYNQETRKFIHRFWRPQGITVDNEGFVYVCEEGTRRVHIFHPEDSNTHVLLDNHSTNWRPWTICFSLADSRLYVGRGDLQCIKVYEVTDSELAKKQGKT